MPRMAPPTIHRTPQPPLQHARPPAAPRPPHCPPETLRRTRPPAAPPTPRAPIFQQCPLPLEPSRAAPNLLPRPLHTVMSSASCGEWRPKLPMASPIPPDVLWHPRFAMVLNSAIACAVPKALTSKLRVASSISSGVPNAPVTTPAFGGLPNFLWHPQPITEFPTSLWWPSHALSSRAVPHLPVAFLAFVLKICLVAAPACIPIVQRAHLPVAPPTSRAIHNFLRHPQLRALFPTSGVLLGLHLDLRFQI